MKKHLFSFMLLLLVGSTACKKEKEAPPKPDPNPVSQPDSNSVVQSNDNNDLKGESDQANTDVTDALENFSTINGRQAVTNAKKVICGCSIDSVGPKTLRLSYDGVTPCGNPSRTRAGKITFTLVSGNRWAQQGSVLNITLDNYKVVRLSDKKSWNFNGVKTLKNVRGTNWIGFLAQTDSLLFRERANGMTVVINNTATVNFSIARTTTWRFIKKPTFDYIQFAATGDTTINGLTNIDTWGTGRFQQPFTNQFLARLVSNTYCAVWRPTSGEVQYKSNNNTLTLKFGVNEAGQSDIRDCAYGWKINWSGANGATGEKIYSY